jgi:hypothetical protein
MKSGPLSAVAPGPVRAYKKGGVVKAPAMDMTRGWGIARKPSGKK